MAKIGVKRSRELELRQNLRVLRRAIDNFHASYVASGGVVHFGQPQASAGGGLPGTAGGQPGRMRDPRS